MNRQDDLFKFYNTISGDADEQAYNSDMLVQKYFQRRKTAVIKDTLQVTNHDLLLDIGCGSGVQIREVVGSQHTRAIGIDVSKNAVEFARKKSIQNTEFLIADAQHLPIKTGCITKVVSAEIIEHLVSPQDLVHEIARVLKDKGEVVITTPNNNALWNVYEYLWDTFGRGRNYGETYISLLTESGLKKEFTGLSECKTRTIFFIAPLLALSNSEVLLRVGRWIDKIFEPWGWGVSIILHARK